MMAKKNIVVADCVAEEIQSFSDALQYEGNPFEIKSHVANWKRTGAISELKRYFTYFYVGIYYFLKRRRYHVIVGWQQFYALIFCFFCNVFNVKKTNYVVAYNFTYKEKKGKAARIYRWFMEKCLCRKYLDCIHVPSANYADTISAEFGFPRERIFVSQFGVNDCYEQLSVLNPPENYVKDGYALSIGRSNRDFDFLIRAWQGLEFPLVIISDTYKGTVESGNITLLTNVAGAESKPWIANCGLMVIPIDDGSVCSGDTVLLTAMSAARKILVTAPSTLAEMYIVDEENALLTKKQEEVFRQKVADILSNEKYHSLGEQARASFLCNYSRRSMGERFSRYLNNQLEH